jgi:diaminopimelate dehydrogenase
MIRLKLTIVGFGALGRACAEAILCTDDLTLAGIVRRPESVAAPLPDAVSGVPTVSNILDLGDVDGALVCVPVKHVQETAHDLLQHKIPVVECAELHRGAFVRHKAAIDKMANRYRTAAVVGAGWDPGMLSLFRGLFALLTPKGDTKAHDRPGASLHHSLTARAVDGVKDALCTEHRRADGAMQRYVYVELEDDADTDLVGETIRSEPLFLGEETLVFPVDSLDTLEDEGRGIVMERWGTSGPTGHQLLLMEARFDIDAFAAQSMIGAARALPWLPPAAHSLLDIAPGTLWGREREREEGRWM